MLRASAGASLSRHTTRRLRLAIIAAVLAVGCLCAAPGAFAAPKVTLHARFSPNRLARSTTLFYEVSISEPTPVESIDLRLPAGATLAGWALGLAGCQPQLPQGEGPEGCPTNSIVGRGTAMGGIRLASQPPVLITEPAHVLFALGPTKGQS